MKFKKLLTGVLLFALSSCDIVITDSSVSNNNSTNSEESSVFEESSTISESNIESSDSLDVSTPNIDESSESSSSNNNSSSSVGSTTPSVQPSTPSESTAPSNSSATTDSSLPSEESSTSSDSSSPSVQPSTPSEESSTSSESSSPSVQPSTPSEESSSPSDSSSPNDSSSSSNNSIIAQKEYYKSLVDRSKIKYSPDFVNDPNHNINQIDIFELNDTHGAYWDDESIVGISRVATVIKNNSSDAYGVVKIANGDMLQGTAFSNMLLGEPAIAALNEMNFDAFVIGNHEFDWGIDNLSVYKDGNPLNGELECPFLGANIRNRYGERPDWIEPYTVVEKGNVKVVIIGII